MAKIRSTTKDAGWGLIFRLNDLWRDVERIAPTGDYDNWNFKLDRIWCNLLYRNEMDIEKDKSGKIISIELPKEDIAIKNFLDEKISEAKQELKKAYNKEEKVTDKKAYASAKNKLYRAMIKKDVWVRKFMQELELYLKEVEYDPGQAIFGG